MLIKTLVNFAVILGITACGSSSTKNDKNTIQIHKVKEIWQGELPDFAKPPYPIHGKPDNSPQNLRAGDTFIHIPKKIINSNTIQIDIYGFWSCSNYNIKESTSQFQEIKMQTVNNNHDIALTFYEQIDDSEPKIHIPECKPKFKKIISLNTLIPTIHRENPQQKYHFNIFIKNLEGNLTAKVNYESSQF